MTIHLANTTGAGRRRTRSLAVKVGVVVLATSLLLAGCASPKSTTPGAETATVALNTFANDTALSWQANGVTAPVYSPVYDALVNLEDSKGKRADSLSTKIDTSADGLTYIFHLRKGVPFHKGYGDVTSEDVVYNMQKWMAPDSTGSITQPFKASVASFEATDPDTVVVHMKAVNWTFLDTISGISWILSKKYVEKVGDQVASQKPVGTGAYEWVSSIPGSEIHYTAEKSHFGKTADFKNLVIRLIPDATTQLSALQSGEVDAVQVSGDAIAQAKSAGFKIITNPGAQQLWVVLPGLSGSDKPDYNPEYPWVGAPDAASQANALKVRQALAMAIDKKAIIDSVFGGYGSTNSFGFYVAKGAPGYSDKWTPLPYKVAEAKKLLAEAGYPNGFQINLADDGQTPDTGTITQAIGQYWSKIGVTVNVTKFDLAKAIGDVAKRSKDWNYAFVYSTPGQLFSSTILGLSSKAAFRFVYASPELDSELAELNANPSADARIKGVTQIENDLVSNQYSLQLASRDATYAVSSQVGSWAMQTGNGSPNNYQYLEPVK